MRIRNVLHKGLRRFIEDDDRSGLPPDFCEKIRNIVFFLQDMHKEGELYAIPNWKPHQLGGVRKGTWSLHVTPNWCITFRVNALGDEIFDLNYEDYHGR
jgi:proteic killer suppression protein